MIDRHPAAVVRAAGAADVMRAVNVAREHQLVLSIRGGGHNIAGNAVCEGGLMLDLTPMKSVRVDPSTRTARVEPGVTLAEFDKEAQAFGLATPLGTNSTTGVAGLTLGGGFGWLSRKLGLTVDNLLSADVVLASRDPDRKGRWPRRGDMGWSPSGRSRWPCDRCSSLDGWRRGNGITSLVGFAILGVLAYLTYSEQPPNPGARRRLVGASERAVHTRSVECGHRHAPVRGEPSGARRASGARRDRKGEETP